MITKYKLFEYIHNNELAENQFEIISNKIENFLAKNNISSKRKKEKTINGLLKFEIRFTLTFDDNNNSIRIIDELHKITQKLNKEVNKHNLFLSSSLDDEYEQEDRCCYCLYLYLKSIKIEQVIPDKYVYHSTSSYNRKSIFKKGLKLRRNIDEEEAALHYPPSIFAMNHVDTKGVKPWDNRGNSTPYDIWRINTSNLKNTWWIDLNVGNAPDLHKDAIMTFEPIPPENIILFKEVKS